MTTVEKSIPAVCILTPLGFNVRIDLTQVFRTRIVTSLMTCIAPMMGTREFCTLLSLLSLLKSGP